MTGLPPVYVVDDDAGLRNSLRFLLSNAGRRVITYESGEAILAECEALEPGPVLLDVRMAGIDGMEVQLELARRARALPVVIMTGHGDISMAVRAIKAGAVDFLTKPFARDDVLEVLRQADARIASAQAEAEQRNRATARLEVLTSREYEVLNELARGLPNKTIGYDLGISSRTVEIHRANLMRKLDVRSFPDALRIAFSAGMPFDPAKSEGSEHETVVAPPGSNRV
ncbi:MAG: response regulator transcription factor [Novosphingobium sp.]